MANNTTTSALLSIERITVIAAGAQMLMGEAQQLTKTALHYATECRIATDAFQDAGRALLTLRGESNNAQPSDVTDERAAFNAWNNDVDCPLAGYDAKTAAWRAWCHRALLRDNTPAAAPVVQPEMVRNANVDVYDPGFTAGWNACRAAMLNGNHYEQSLDMVQSLQTHPALELKDPSGVLAGPIAQRWIPCSERMPETDGNYWGWWSESKRQGPVWFIKSELQAQFQSSEITHWMPLPAAPTAAPAQEDGQ